MSLSGWSASNYLTGAANQADPVGDYSLFAWVKATSSYNNAGGFQATGFSDGMTQALARIALVSSRGQPPPPGLPMLILAGLRRPAEL